MVYNPVNPADALDQSVIDINDAFDKVARWFQGPTAPSGPEPLMKWFNTTDSILYVRSLDNLSWIPCKLMDSETGMIVSDGTEKITICAPSTLSQDYVLKLPPAQGGSQQFLRNDGSGNLEWVSGGASGATELDGLSDVAITGAPDGSYLQKISGSWIDTPTLDIGDLAITGQTRGDVIARTASGWGRLPLGTSGQVLTSDGTDVGWADPAGGGGGATTLAALTDTSIPGPATGEYLRYSAGLWRDSALLAADIATPTSATGDILVRGAGGYERLALGTNGQVLASNGSAPVWSDPAAGGSSTLADLTDTTITAATEGEYLRFGSGAWRDSALLLTDLSVANEAAGDLAYFNGSAWNRLPRGASGQFLRATASTVQWQTVALGAQSLDDLSDVNLTPLGNNQFLRSNGVSWINSALTIGLISISGTARGDLMVRGALVWQRLARGTSGQVLSSNGTDLVWIDAPGGGSSTLAGLADTAIASPAAGQYVRFNGSTWANSALTSQDITAGADAVGDILVRGAGGYSRLGIGTLGQVLTSTGSTAQWSDAPGGGSSTLAALADVALGTPVSGEFLRYNGSAWVDAAIQLSDLNAGSETAGDLAYFNGTDWTRLARGASGQFLRATASTVQWQTVALGSTTLAGLSDTSISAAATGEYLRFSAGLWRDSALLASDLTITGQARGDFITRSATTWTRLPLGTNGQVLTSNGTDAVWADPAGGGGSSTLDGLADTALVAPAAGEYLRNNGAAWVDSPLLLADLTIGSQAAGDLAYFDGSAWNRLARGTTGQFLRSTAGSVQWETVSLGGASTLDDLTDVDVSTTSPSAGEVLRFSGVGWFNEALSIGDLSSAGTSSGDLMVRGVGGDWERLAIGIPGTILYSTGSSPIWLSNTLSVLSDTALVNQQAGQYLRRGVGAWQNSDLLATDLIAGSDAQGDILVRGASGYQRLALGTSGQVLTSDGTDVGWATPAGGTGVSNLGDLGDVTIASPQAGHVLRYNGSLWSAETLALSEIAISGQTIGDIAWFNGSTWTRLPRSFDGRVLTCTPASIAWETLPSQSLAALTDTTITTPGTGEYLRWSGIRWQDSPLLVDDLFVTSAANGDMIVRAGGKFTRLGIGTEGQVLTSTGGAVGWATPSGGGSSTLSALTDTTITSAAVGDYLRYDGTDWVDHAGVLISDLTITGEDRGDLIVYDGAGWNRLAVGAPGQVLTSQGSTFAWDDLPAGVSGLNDLTDVSTVGAGTGDLLVRGASSWGILDASAAAANSVLEWTGSALQYVGTTGTGNVVRHTAPTFSGTVTATSFEADANNKCQSMSFRPITGGDANTVTLICPANGTPYNILLPQESALPSSGEFYMKINSSGQIVLAAT